MKHFRFITCLLFLFIGFESFSQNRKTEWYVTANGNFYMPVGNRSKGMYPILWYDKTTSPKILLGGVGTGAALLKPLSKDFSFKAQANLSKHTYWEDLTLMRDYVGSSIGYFQAGSSDYGLGVAAMIHYFPVESFSIGAGLSGQATLISLSRTPGMYVGADIDPGIVVNRYYKAVVPMVPVELSYTVKRLLFNVRYEAGLINRIKGDLANFKSDKYSLLTFELGFRIN
ncbi:hypothetical protein [Dyadobacter sp. Leaf189]|uniref:hypothetical protein n=1 Tax=Dyadobacter sp. Leaf189 TaxID=1736295 RepID=UPI0006F8A570|nr:hypothetical protein [Dyadobacter sp. Leaf189]KQS24746.1 hypothetical protein ASG33_23620 [Dyadobacter sp. Leaf189]